MASEEGAKKDSKLYTLVLIKKEEKILLGLKKRGFAEGKWDGFGGKVEEGESVEEAARRELEEECCVSVPEMSKIAILRHEFEDDPVIMEIHVFKAENLDGTPTETEEMKPAWFSMQEIPFEKMWEDNKLWYIYMFTDQKFTAHFKYRGHDTIMSYDINVTDNLQ